MRIKGNSLRLRLSQSEIDLLKKEKRVRDSLNFGPTELTYTLQINDDQPDITASFEGNDVLVRVSSATVNPWVETNQVGIEKEQPLAGAEKLSILIEKDFQCLKPRAREDEGDLFRNPLAED